MTPFADIFEVTMTTTFRNQVFNNVFFYGRRLTVAPDDGSPLNALEAHFTEEVWGALGVVLPSTLFYTRFQARELFPGFDFRDTNYSDNYPGAAGGAACPPYTAYKLVSPRKVGNIRAGWKRFSPVMEAGQENGIITTGYMSLLDALAGTLNVFIPVKDAGGVTHSQLEPIIIKRIKETDAEGNVSYRLPANDAETVYVQATYTAQNEATTQNSRKIGRGQ